jgi:hypothetical protein
MTIASSLIAQFKGQSPVAWNTALNASDTTPQEVIGSIRWDVAHPYFGVRGFKYVRFDAATTAGDVCTKVADVTITNISAGTTTSITTSGLTADIHVGGILYCTDDAGGAGAAPEGEQGIIVANTATSVQIRPEDAFSVSPAANDDFSIVKTWAVGDAAAGDLAVNVQGVAMADQAQYSWGWVQFLGLHPQVLVVAAGTAVTINKSLIAGNGGLLTNGSSSADSLLVGFLRQSVASDQVVRKAMVDLYCGAAYKVGASA